SLPCDGGAVVGMTFAIHTLAEIDSTQKIDGASLQHAGANAAQDMRPALPLEHHAVDAVEIEHVRQQQPGRAAADDRHLSSRCHGSRRMARKSVCRKDCRVGAAGAILPTRMRPSCAPLPTLHL